MNRMLGARSHGRDLGKILPNLGITFHKMRTPSLPHRAAVSRTRWKCPRRPSGLSPSTLPSPRSASCWPWHVLSRLQDFLDSQKSHRKKVPSPHLGGCLLPHQLVNTHGAGVTQRTQVRVGARASGKGPSKRPFLPTVAGPPRPA